MKIKIEPAFVTLLNLDTATESAIMKQHLPRAKKIATATNLLTLLGQRYGSAESVNHAGSTAMTSNRWLDIDPNRSTPQPHITEKNSNSMTSEVGILTSEITVNADVTYALCYQHIRVYIPLDPAHSVTIWKGVTGTYPERTHPCICFSVEIQ